MKTTNAEQKTMKIAEASREEWTKQSFFKSIFMGEYRPDLIDPFPEFKHETEGFSSFMADYRQFLHDEVDADEIDRTGEIPHRIMKRLKEMKLFALKIDPKYGGLGFSQAEYNEILKVTASKDANLVALLSAHQSIGVPQPLIMFGTEEQREKYLPRFAEGQISAFALTEVNVGSDPANLETTVQEVGDNYILNGSKLWTTNGTIADVIVVMAKHTEDEGISAFIVEMDWEGVSVDHRCHFMGLRALYNGVISFHNVKVPKENLIGEKGKGLKLALVTLNTGRLALPAAICGGMMKALEITRHWALEREQWGKPIYKHEAIAQKISDLTVNTFAIEAVSNLATALYDRHEDIRLEAAVAKLLASEYGWQGMDDLLQIRGGRGYETADSLRGRGEDDYPVERMMRDFRINRIFEGSTEIMRLFIAREAVDEHLKISGVLLDQEATWGQKLKALPKIFAFYFIWYLKLWIPSTGIARKAKKLSRQVFHGMIWHGPGLQNKQGFLFRLVDIAVEIYTQAAVTAYAKKLGRGHELAGLYCENSDRKLRTLFHELWFNSDEKKYILAQTLEKERYYWLEQGIIEHRNKPQFSFVESEKPLPLDLLDLH